jgi:hypothetical protein
MSELAKLKEALRAVAERGNYGAITIGFTGYQASQLLREIENLQERAKKKRNDNRRRKGDINDSKNPWIFSSIM